MANDGDEYDAAANAYGSWHTAIDALRLEGVKAGRFLPLADRPEEIKASPLVRAVRQVGPCTLYLADCRAVLPRLSHMDACVTDPPYELGFMGKGWDSSGVAAAWETWGGVRIALKPGAHLVAFAGSRTYHRIAAAIDDAGFEVRDQVMWIYGSGFPKSLDVAKAIDKGWNRGAAEVRRVVVLTVTRWIAAARDAAGLKNRDIDAAFGLNGMAGHWTSSKSQPAVPTADQWPRLLEILGVDIPPDDVRAAVDEWLQIRGQPSPVWQSAAVLGQHAGDPGGFGAHRFSVRDNLVRDLSYDAKRWKGWGTALKPAHEPVCFARKPLSEATVAANVLKWATGALNVEAGKVGSEALAASVRSEARLGTYRGTENGITPERQGRWPANVVTDGSLEVYEAFPRSARDSIRFFYSAKADKAEREAGLAREAGVGALRDGGRGAARANHHPTVKPVDLMAWLCRLVTPPGGTVLDPFMGSGTTGIAAFQEGFSFIGIEQDPDYFDIATKRIENAVRLAEVQPDIVRAVRTAPARAKPDKPADLFGD